MSIRFFITVHSILEKISEGWNPLELPKKTGKYTYNLCWARPDPISKEIYNRNPILRDLEPPLEKSYICKGLSEYNHRRTFKKAVDTKLIELVNEKWILTNLGIQMMKEYDEWLAS